MHLNSWINNVWIHNEISILFMQITQHHNGAHSVLPLTARLPPQPPSPLRQRQTDARERREREGKKILFICCVVAVENIPIDQSMLSGSNDANNLKPNEWQGRRRFAQNTPSKMGNVFLFFSIFLRNPQIDLYTREISKDGNAIANPISR